jgi:hypothetical protein
LKLRNRLCRKNENIFQIRLEIAIRCLYQRITRSRRFVAADGPL